MGRSKEEREARRQAMGEFKKKLREAVFLKDYKTIENLLVLVREMKIPEDDDILKARELFFHTNDPTIFHNRITWAIDRDQPGKIHALLLDAYKYENYHIPSIKKARAYHSKKLEIIKKIIAKDFPSRDYTQLFNELKTNKSVSQYPYLRNSNSFARRKLFFVNEDAKRGMLCFSRTVIPKSLVAYELIDKGGWAKHKVKEFSALAIEMHQLILEYTGVLHHSRPHSLASKILSLVFQNPTLSDELFIQLIKQTTSNEDSLSALLTFKLLFLALIFLRPLTEDLLDIVKAHVASFSIPTVNKLTTFDKIEEIAVRCFELLLKNPLPKEQFFSHSQLEEFYNLKSEVLKISLIFDVEVLDVVDIRVPYVPRYLQPTLFESDSHLTVRHLAVAISHQLKLPFIGRIKIDFCPVEIKSDGNDILTEDQDLFAIFELTRRLKSTKKRFNFNWILIPLDPEDQNETQTGRPRQGSRSQTEKRYTIGYANHSLPPQKSLPYTPQRAATQKFAIPNSEEVRDLYPNSHKLREKTRKHTEVSGRRGTSAGPTQSTSQLKSRNMEEKSRFRTESLSKDFHLGRSDGKQRRQTASVSVSRRYESDENLEFNQSFKVEH